MTKLKFNLYGLVIKVIKLLLIFDRRLAGSSESFNPLILHLQKLLSTRGVDDGLSKIKDIRATFMNYLSGNPQKVGSVRITWDGIPTCFGPLIQSIRGDPPVLLLKVITTILFATRAVKGTVKPDISSITAPSEWKGELYIGNTARLFWNRLGYFHQGRVPSSLKWKKFHFTTKTGPNGHALNTYLQDLVSLPKQLTDAICVVGGSKLKFILEAAQKNVWELAEGKLVTSGSIRRITSFSDKEGKTRTIAILDYWSQTVLKNLHLYLFKVLRKIPQDCTFDQHSFKEKIKGWEIFYSVDLKSATDRFPIEIISRVLKGILPPEYVNAWEQIMVGEPFDLPGKTAAGAVRYQVGNPMGAYSSWASFAVAHHYLFFQLCLDLDIKWSEAKYVLLGDDVLIGDHRLGQAYLSLITKLGMKYSVQKTHISPVLCEFAKRWIYKGSDISPFPISALKSCQKKWYNLLTLFSEQSRLGWEFGDQVPQVVSSFYGVVLNMPSRFRKGIFNKAILGEQILLHIWGLQRAHESITGLVRTLGTPGILQPISEYTGNSIFINAVVNLFSQSDPSKSTKATGRPLGLLATEWVMKATSFNDERQELFLNVPLLHAYGQIEQQYVDLLQKARSIDTIGKGEWPLVLRNCSIPLSDSIFIDRVEQTESISSAKLMREIISSLEVMSLYPSLQI